MPKTKEKNRVNSNPAQRLYVLLDSIRSQDSVTPIRTAWAKAFNVQDDDIAGIVVGVADVVKLIEEIKVLIAGQEVDHNLYLRPFGKIQYIFALGWNDRVFSTKEYLDDVTMIGLEHCSELLSRVAGEQNIELEVLTQIQSDVDTLIERVLAASLPNNLEPLLLDSLHFVRQSILNYRIHGARGIESAIKNTLGSIQYYTMQSDKELHVDENGKQVIRQYVTLLEQLLSIAANALNIPQLVGGVALRLLGSGMN